jgi:glycosyltransferase involved in cell wall biosynthesis
VSIVHQVFSSQPRSFLLNTLFKIVEKAYLASVDAFIFNSETTRGRVQRLINFRRPSIVANPGGDRLGHLQEAGQLETRARRSGPLRMVCVANLSPIKGLVPLIETLATLPPEIWQLTVVGSLDMNPGYVRRVRRLIAAKNIGRQVLLLGPLAGSELKDILSGSQLFVMPFADEGFGIANLEALAYGLPVLASASGAAREYIRHGNNGFLFASGEGESVAEIISELHNDRDHLLQMSERALQTAMERPGWSKTMESIEHFLLDRVKTQKN